MDDCISDCLLQSMSRIQKVDRRASCHGHATCNFSCLFVCEQLISAFIRVSGSCLDSVFIDIPGLVDVSIQPVVPLITISLVLELI